MNSSSNEKSVKVIKAGLGYTIGNYLIKGLSFLTLPLFTRLMDTSSYGIYNSFSAYSSLFFVLVGFAIHSSYRNAKLKYHPLEKYYSYISSTMILVLLGLLIWGILCIPFGKYIGNLLGLSKTMVYVLVLYSFSLAVITCFNSYSSVEYKYKAFLLIAGANAVVSIVLSILLILFVFKKRTYMGRTLGTAIPSVLISVLIIGYFFKVATPPKKNIKPFLRWGVRYSLPIIPHGISQLVLAQFDRIMILQMIGSAVAGVYSFAYNIFSIVTVTTTSLDNVWSTWLYEQLHSKNNRAIKKYSSIYALGILIYLILLMLISPELVKLLGPSAYAHSVYAVVPLITGGYFSFLYTLPATIEYYYEKTAFIMIGTILAAVLNIVLNLIFLIKYSYVAAAYTTLITYIAYFVLHYFIAKSIVGKSLFSTKLLSLLSLIVIIMNFFVLVTLKMVIIRWILAILIFVVAMFVEEKYLGLIKQKLLNILKG
ncbi:oligosaccharide flippase family protein [Lactiplantibacillus plantarum]|uniref:oligosaccharide flippase family protein n=1 Tax=Lactiplantibacillus plantarum TaxID=1590 RepID=UPI0037550829